MFRSRVEGVLKVWRYYMKLTDIFCKRKFSVKPGFKKKIFKDMKMKTFWIAVETFLHLHWNNNANTAYRKNVITHVVKCWQLELFLLKHKSVAIKRCCLKWKFFQSFLVRVYVCMYVCVLYVCIVCVCVVCV